MLLDFNLIATSERGYESAACSELWMLLRAVGDEVPAVDRSPVRGLIVARTGLDPVEATKRLREELHRSPGDFRTLLRVLPVELVVPTEMKAIVEAAHGLASRMEVAESFRVTVEKNTPTGSSSSRSSAGTPASPSSPPTRC